MGIPETVYAAGPESGIMTPWTLTILLEEKESALLVEDAVGRRTGLRGILNDMNCAERDRVTHDEEYSPVPPPGGRGI